MSYNLPHRSMNEDIQEFGVFILTPSGRLVKAEKIKSTDNYDHSKYNLHHFIPKHDFNKNRKWYEERKIQQKLILMPIFIHEIIHGIGIKTVTDEQFKSRFKISKWDLIFNRKYSEY